MEGRRTRRQIPSVDRVLRELGSLGVLDRYKRSALVTVIREVLSEARLSAANGGPAPSAEEAARTVQSRVVGNWTPSPTSIINATGVVLHTNLGRAPLSEAAVTAIHHADAYSDLELDLSTGERDNRQRRVASMLTVLTGAEAALVTGNNAGAMLLCLSVLARGREIIVSRGQAVEIGGGFRVPEILRQSGARLVDVGTTNRTRVEDYETAVSQDTAAILHIHPSNFRVAGFTGSPSLRELASLSQRKGILLLDDNGAGPLIDTAVFGLEHEPTPVESLSAGSDVVTFSGDKLLGGPQSGIALGRAELIGAMAASPLARALRPDKLALAALRATLAAYLEGSAERTLPIWQMISQSRETVAARAQEWSRRAAKAGISVDLREGESAIGGGSLPGSTLPTVHVVLPPQISAAALRKQTPAVLAITRDGRALLDLRTVPQAHEEALLSAVVALSA